MDTVKNSKPAGIILITLIYILATAFGIFVYVHLPFAFWASLLIADTASTIFVFIFSLIFKNASVYDPYWSVQPVIIVFAFSFYSKLTLASVLVLVSVTYWGIRLTGNWAYTFGGMKYQDWRYTKLGKDTGKLYPVINFAGIHMVPTLVVYGATIPAVFLIREEARANAGSFIGTLICIGAATLQLVADTQMHRYRKSGTKGLINTGLWKFARHPNYLGEILMWWGVGLQAVSVMPLRWYLFAGAAANTILFFTVSIPMADKRQSSKPGYSEYRARTRSLLPIPKRSA